MAGETKVCAFCKQETPLSAFHRDSSRADGLQRRCKKCHVAGNRRLRDQRREEGKRGRYGEYSTGRARSKTEWKQKNPAANAAHKAVQRALSAGELVWPGKCEECDRAVYRPNREVRPSELHVALHAHHDDYSEPLEVRWLCSVCHRVLHAAEQEFVA